MARERPPNERPDTSTDDQTGPSYSGPAQDAAKLVVRTYTDGCREAGWKLWGDLTHQAIADELARWQGSIATPCNEVADALDHLTAIARQGLGELTYALANAAGLPGWSARLVSRIVVAMAPLPFTIQLKVGALCIRAVGATLQSEIERPKGVPRPPATPHITRQPVTDLDDLALGIEAELDNVTRQLVTELDDLARQLAVDVDDLATGIASELDDVAQSELEELERALSLRHADQPHPATTPHSSHDAPTLNDVRGTRLEAANGGSPVGGLRSPDRPTLGGGGRSDEHDIDPP